MGLCPGRYFRLVNAGELDVITGIPPTFCGTTRVAGTVVICTMDTRVEEAAIRKAAVEKLRAARSALDQHLASESSLTAVVGFLSSVKEKRALRARLAIGDLVPGLETAKRVSDIEDRVRTELRAAEKALQSAE